MIWGIFVGIITIFFGIIKAKHSKKKIWHIFTFAGVGILGVSLFFAVCTLLLTSNIQQQPEIESDIQKQVIESNSIRPEKISEEKPYCACSFNKLKENQKLLYKEVESKIIAKEDFSYDTETYGYDVLDDIFVVWSALSEDDPEIDNYFIIDEKFDDSGKTTSLDSKYFCVWTEDESTDKQELSKGLKLFDQICKDIIDEMPKNVVTFQKYKYLAQELSKRVDYDYSMSMPAIAAPYGIVTGKMICQGYAEAYQVLCKKAGLWCRTVSGASGDMSHAWNLIWLNDGTYHIDITWADEEGEPGSKEWMNYFMLTQEEILVDHKINDGTIATGISHFFAEEDSNKQVISEEKAVDLVTQVLVEQKIDAPVILVTGEEIINKENCILLSAGSYSEGGEKYTAMYHYAVSDSELIYYMDVLSGPDWNLYK